MLEPLDLCNVIEVAKIRKLLIEHPDLLSMFELMIIIANKRLNKDKVYNIIQEESEEEVELSDHESDEDLMPNPEDDY